MTKSELMDYLVVWRCSTTGSKHALVARAFVAWENKEPIKLNAQALKDKLHHYFTSRFVGPVTWTSIQEDQCFIQGV